MANIPIALQLYSVRDDCQVDFPKTLEAVAQMGYAGVEFAGYYDFTAPQLRQMLKDLGLQVAGTHTMLDTLQGDQLEQTVEFNKELGNQFLILPILWDRKTRDEWLRAADELNEVAEKLRPYDMFTGYHNHFDEFKPIDGEMPWDIVISNTKPEVVMQMDTGNSLQAGADSVQFLERYPGRAKTVHLKEYTPKNNQALIGEGNVRWPEVFQLCESVAGTQWYIVEQEQFAYPPLECAKRNLEALRAMGR